MVMIAIDKTVDDLYKNYNNSELTEMLKKQTRETLFLISLEAPCVECRHFRTRLEDREIASKCNLGKQLFKYQDQMFYKCNYFTKNKKIIEYITIPM